MRLIKLIFFIILTNTSLFSDDIPRVYYTKEAFQGDKIYFVSDKIFNTFSILGTNKKPILSSNSFEFKIGNKTYYIALIGMTPMIKEGEREIEIEFEDKKYVKQIIIKKFEFKQTVISFKMEKAKLITHPSPKRKEQAITLWNIIGTVGDTTIYHYDRLVEPLKDKYIRTSPYGDLRVYMGANKKISNSTMHEGNDYAPYKRDKTPIFAAGRGKVVFAGKREISGNTVIIQHLPGVFTLYFHLSKIRVKENKIVNSGEYLGKVGMTGLATGPHLHFEVRINGIALNSDFFIENMLIDKNQIMNHIKKIE